MNVSHFRDSLDGYWFVDLAYEELELESVATDRAYLRENATHPMPYLREHRPGEFGPMVSALLAQARAQIESEDPYGGLPFKTKVFVEVWLYEDGTMVRRPAVYSQPIIEGGDTE